MENNINIITSVLHLKEASDLLIEQEPEISYTLLQLSKAILDNCEIDETQMKSAIDLVDKISSNDLSSIDNQ